MYASTLGETIAKLRTNASLTQDELAKQSNLHRVTISDIERNVISPSIDNLTNICSALGIELYELFSQQSERKSLKIHQPHSGKLGDQLITALQSSEYKQLNLTVAYAKLSGVSRIKSSLKVFKSNGGKINCFIGIDQFNTTYEALLELFYLSDKLYVIHNENFSHTYHPKVYMLDNNIKNPNKAWLSIGSNNLTAGGLFINYESCSIDLLDIHNYWDNKSYNDTLELFKRYSDPGNSLSLFIDSQTVIDDLLERNYIKTESQSKISSIKGSSESKPKQPLFGSESFKAPVAEYSDISDSSDENLNENYDVYSTSQLTTPKEPLSESDDIIETFWFEMRKSTGGSRNILDLSSTAKLRGGIAQNTRYYIKDNDIICGGINFFDIDANSHNTTKDISISYKGNDYFPSTILYASNNQSWRLQLKGESPTDDKALSQYGNTDFVNNILLFHKISSDNYILEVLDPSELDNLKNSSIFFATNGTPKKSKSFGKLK